MYGRMSVCSARKKTTQLTSTKPAIIEALSHSRLYNGQIGRRPNIGETETKP